MKIRRIISVVLVALLMMSVFTVAASAADADLADSGAANQSYLETYATQAAKESGLGATYTPTATTFKVWAPEATSVQVKMFTTGTDAESGAAVIGTANMTYNSTTGIWSLTKQGDLKNTYYTYLVTRSGVVSETVDPYAKGVGANGDRSMVVDLDSTDPEGWDQDNHVLFNNPGEAVVWEVHVRDFSIDVSSGVSEANRGKYLAFTEGDTTVNGGGAVSSCVDYLVEHNVNCVQLMPIEDFASIDETDNQVKRNWGYDPKNYNVPEGSYASDPYDGNVRIKEFKRLVQALHDRGISVVMDVVYNHTFVREGSPFSKTVPKYFYRMSNMSTNSYNNGSGLGNVLSTEKAMTRKYVQDSLMYWATEYHIDGFRFDLMGCHDVASVKAWRSALDTIDSRILMYGEPWAGGSDNGIAASLAVGKTTMNQMTRVGAFNEGYSDSLKGSHENATGTGFLNGGSNAEILKAAGGTSSEMSGTKPEQLIQYTDNHDNFTLFDKILAANRTSGFTTGKDDAALYDKNKNAVNNPSAQALGQMKVALTSSLTTQGIPFTVAGTEFCRTKYGDQNSYRTPDKINAIDWGRANTYKAISDYYAGLIAIRKACSAFGDTTANGVTTISSSPTTWQITNSKSGEWNKVIVSLNNSASNKSISLSGNWVVVANGTNAGTASLGNASGTYTVPAWSSVVLVDASSFGNYSQPALGTASVTVEHYTRDTASGSYTKKLTETAKYKEGQTWRASQNLDILFDHNLTTTESTAANNATYGSAVAGQNITVKFYYTREIGSGVLTVNFKNTTDNTQVKAPMTYRLKDGDKFSIPAPRVQGYELDTAKVPGNTISTFDSSKPATFDFYYKKLTNTTTKVHYYNSKGWSYVNCYAYDDLGNEPLGAWATQGKRDASLMKDDPDESDSKWLVVTVPSAACKVMFHNVSNQVPDQGEPGYEVAGEAWIKDNVASFNCTIVTSHIDLYTGEKLSADVSKSYTNIRSNQTYSTSPDMSINREVIAPALATGFYQPGVLNVVYLYGEEKEPVSALRYGDIDMDNVVTIMDVTVLQRALADMIQLTEDQQTVADVNLDDSIDALDATTIQRYLAEMKVPGSQVGRIVGEAPVGEHTYDEFVNAYNALNALFAKYPASAYSSNAAWQQAQAALTEYAATYTDPNADPDVIDAGYDACYAAYVALSAVPIDEPVPDPDPSGRTIIFSNNKGFSSVNIYYWSDSDQPVEWPGVPMTYLDTNEYGEDRYTFEMPEGMDNYIITDGTQQTVDVQFTGSTGVYMLDEQDDFGHYEVGFYEIEDNPNPNPDPDPDPDPVTGNTIIFSNNKGFSSVNIYYWSDSETPVEWPGVPMTYLDTNDYGESRYTYDLPAGMTNYIITDGTQQTVDIPFTGATGVYMLDTTDEMGHYEVGFYEITEDPTPSPDPDPDPDPTPDPTGRTIVFSNNKGFSSVNIYYWSDSDQPAEWPGVPMTYLDTNDYGESRYTFDLPEGYDNFIITDGSAQTVDLQFTGATGIYMLDTTDSVGHYEVGYYEI